MFPTWQSFMKCDLKMAKMLANHTQGVGEGFKFVLNKWKPYYFACGEKNRLHCNVGQMKFAIMPMIRPF
ncbi:putative cupredoxin [Medicago truncatula]|nr:putative cupredoxin [Medicago truncatula]